MLHFIYGPDGYRVRQAVATAFEKAGFNRNSSRLNVIHAEEPGAGPALDAAVRNSSLFPEAKFIWVSGIFSKSLARATAILSTPDIRMRPELIVIASETGNEPDLAKKDKELFKILAGANSSVTRVPFLSGSDLEKWIKSECAARGVQIEPPAVKKLISLGGAESWALVQEINKLSCYVLDRPITAQDVGTLVFQKLDTNIFDLTDALISKNKPRALALLYQELHSGRDPYHLFALVVSQFRNLVMAKDLQVRAVPTAAVAQKIGIHPYAAQKIAAAARRFESSELTACYSRLLELDIATKQGRADLTDELYQFILNLR